MKEYTVVVGLGNPNNVERLMHIGCMMANEYNGCVEGVTVVSVDQEAPRMTPKYHDRMSRAYSILATAEEAAARCNAHFDGHLAVGREVAQVLSELAASTDAQLIIVGFSERLHPGGNARDFDRLVDEIAAHAPCNLLVARFLDGAKYERVLVPVREQMNLDIRRDLLLALQDQFGSQIDVVHFASSENQTEKMHHELELWLDERGVAKRFRLRVEVREDPAAAIVEATEDYDLVVLATSPLHEVRRKYFGPVIEHVANNAACTTFLVRTGDIHA